MQRGLEILGGLGRLAKIIQHETAIHIAGGHFRVEFERSREVLHGGGAIAVVGMHIAGDQRKIFILGEDRFVLGHESKGLVIAAEIVEIVGEIDHTFAIIRQLVDDLVSELSRLCVIALLK